MKTSNIIEATAELLTKARLQNCLVDEIPQTILPSSLEEAYAIQQRLIEILDWEIGGWFCGCTNKAAQSMLNLNEPYYACLFESYIFESGKVLNATECPPIFLECEFAFRLRYSLPPKKNLIPGLRLSLRSILYTRP